VSLRRPRTLVWVLGFLLWASAVGAGMSALTRYKATPGVAAVAPERWPADAKLERNPRGATLVMLAHPRCPCTRASVAELAQLMARVGDRVTAYVLFVRPEGVTDGWERTDLWQSAANIPGVSVVADVAGREAALFGAKTSGQAIVYQRDGSLLFRGGITPARGHQGDNAGRTRILKLLEGAASERRDSPVFGCELDDEKL
jgi:hypothetical protein